MQGYGRAPNLMIYNYYHNHALLKTGKSPDMVLGYRVHFLTTIGPPHLGIPDCNPNA
jgi:hypothetical protein